MQPDTLLWTEKYRPRHFSDLIGQEEIVRRVQGFVSQGNMPHLLFAGPPGTGKTTLALVIARELYGEHWRQNFLELNASDERGIDIIRTKVKDFARTKPLGKVPFKIIYLDEADALTREAQQALRRTMELYTSTCRFILACNYSSKIIEPIQSRCAVFRFKPLPMNAVKQLIQHIAQQEGLTVDEDAIDALIAISNGDSRRVINVLQSSAVLGTHITAEMIFQVAAVARPQAVREILEAALRGEFLTARKNLLTVMLDYGLSGLDMTGIIHKTLLQLDLPEDQRARLLDRLAEAEFRMVEGSDEYLQLEAFLATLALQDHSST